MFDDKLDKAIQSNVLQKVISGGQTGADRAGLIAAKHAGIETGGYMPKGFIAQDGKHPEFAEMFGIQEHDSPKYPPRTALNAKTSDGTIRFATDWNSRGELLTLKMIRQYHKPYFDVELGATTPEEVVKWLIDNNIRVLNVAGNSESTSPGITGKVVHFLTQVFQTIHNTTPTSAEEP